MQTWLITGCSTGFGRELELAVLARGWHVAVTARSPADIADIAAAHPERSLALKLDVRERSQIAEASQTKRPVARATLRLRPRRQAFGPSTSITRINLWDAASPRPRLKSWGVFAVLTLPIVPAYLCYAQWIFRGETTVGTANGE